MAIDGTCDRVNAPIRELEDGHQIACHLSLDELNAAEAEAQKILRGYEKLGVDKPVVV